MPEAARTCWQQVRVVCTAPSQKSKCSSLQQCFLVAWGRASSEVFPTALPEMLPAALPAIPVAVPVLQHFLRCSDCAALPAAFPAMHI
eukprot:354787-Alexandrium_andersonii.AAC.2